MTNALLAASLLVSVLVTGCWCSPPLPNPQPPTVDGNEPPSTGDDSQPPSDANAPGDADGDDATWLNLESQCAACHSVPRGDRRAVVDSSGRGGHLALLTDASCGLCHEMTRHREGRVRLWADVLGRTSVIALPADSVSSGEIASFCGNCHAGSEYAGHAPTGDWRPSCSACHDVHAWEEENLALIRTAIFNRSLGASSPVVFAARSGPGSFSDGAGANDGVCQVCHTVTAYHRHDGSGTSHREGVDCTGCHPHSAGFVPAGGASCIGCHSVAQGSRAAVVNADGSGGHHLQSDALSDDDCAVCHDMSQHQQGRVRLWEDPGNPTTALVVTGAPSELTSFCDSCHSALTHPTIHAVGGAAEPACTECHELHDPANGNLALVRDVVHNRTLNQDKTVVFTARTGPGSFDDGDPAANDGICQVCHTVTTYHRHDGSGAPHQEGDDCTACHPHSEGLMPTGGSCVGCHSTPRGSRPAVVNADGTGGHDLRGGALTDEDCVTCHEMTQHQQGQVRLWSDPANPVATLVVTGDPAELEPFCDACHAPLTHPTGHAAGGAWEPVCTECHELHDPASGNLSLIRDVVYNQTLSQDRAVVFTTRTGASSFDDGDPAANDGICQVCHTTTAYHTQDGTGVAHRDGETCSTCHPHDAGFLPGGGSCDACHGQPPDGAIFPDQAGSHAAHMGAGHGPGIADCFECHNALIDTHPNGLVSFASGVDANGDGNIELSETDVCDSCHSPDGAYDGVNDPALGAKANWADGVYDGGGLAAGKEEWCAGCHDAGTSTVQGVSAPPVAGDDATWGYYATGHGRGLLVACDDCHDVGAAHIDGAAQTYVAAADNYQAGFRLKSVGGSVPLVVPLNPGVPVEPYDDPPYWELCLACHDRHALFGGPTAPPGAYFSPQFQTNFRSDASVIIPDGVGTDIARYSMTGDIDFNSHYEHVLGPALYYDSDRNGAADSHGTCVACHNVHGSTSPAMVRDGKLLGAEPALKFSYVRYDRHDPPGGGPCGDPIIMTSAGSVALAQSQGGVMRAAGSIGGNGICSFCHPSGAATDDPEYIVNCFGPDSVDYYRTPVVVPAPVPGPF